MASSEENDTQTLSVIFKNGLDLYNKITNSQEPTNSPEIQVSLLVSFFGLIKKCLLI